MKFSLLDRVLELEPGQRITALKGLSLAEEYLADHFPRAPVMPGVLMLEALVQASAWLVRATEQFAHSVVVLKEVRAAKYANFVEPGHQLQITAELTGQDDRYSKLKAQGQVDGNVAVSARLVLERYNLRDTNPLDAATDAWLIGRMKELFAILNPPVSAPPQ